MTNIVVCFDGTGATVRATGNTNVVRLFEMLSNDDRQLTYSDPGVGTFSSGGAWTPAAQWLSRTFGLAFGAGRAGCCAFSGLASSTCSSRVRMRAALVPKSCRP